MFTLTIVSVNGGEYPSSGEFASIADAQKYIPRSFRGMSSYWRIWIRDAKGNKVVKCTRSGPNGTGERWTFEPYTEA